MPPDGPKAPSELLALAAERDGCKAEWYAGKIVMRASASALHSLIVSETVRRIPSERWWALPGMGGRHAGRPPRAAAGHRGHPGGEPRR
ncbi:hypothetical protein GCM10010466_51730 [Planomonospora alba]|uniref:Restriction endonuclease domain-containing protein n=1 Tax=Planomonospora alba TaxID=161354 RepID=A0ABP6NPY3_9ACTN